MKTSAFLLPFVAFVISTPALAQSVRQRNVVRTSIATPEASAVPGRYRIRLRPSDAAALAGSRGAIRQLRAGTMDLLAAQLSEGSFRVRRRLNVGGWVELDGPAFGDPAVPCATLRTLSGVTYAEPVRKITPLLGDPNDLDYRAQETSSTYILDLTGDNEGLSFRRLWHLDDVDAAGGWDLWPNTWYTAATKPRDCPTIAVIDTGIDKFHPDFANAGSTSTDSVNGGQIRLADSRNVIDGQPATSFGDSNGHGTHVAGLALAAGNNGGFSGHGVVGTGYGCRGLIFRVFDESGNGDDSDAAGAIVSAADTGAEVINLSLGTTSFSQVFQDAVTYASQKGSLVIAAGNESGSGGGNLGPIYPAACSGVLGVTANGPDGVPANNTYSGYGQYVDIAAPGGDLIQSTEYFIIQFVFSTAPRYPNDISQNPNLYPPFTLDYSYLAGTSMASPIVAGAAGSYFGRFNLRQGSYNNFRAFRAIERSAYGVLGAPYGGWELRQGFGCLDMGTLLADGMTRTTTRGGIEGILYLGGTALANVAVQAKNLSTNIIYGTTTLPDGTYRFGVIPEGIYELRAAPFGNVKRRNVRVIAGSDRPGTDIWANGAPFEETAPVAARLSIASASATSVSFDHWGYDPETGIDKTTVRIGTTSGGNNILAAKELFPETSREVLSGLSLANGTYYLTLAYTNGNNMVTERTVPFTIGTTATVNGTISFDSWVATIKPVVTVEVLNAANAVLESHIVQPSTSGAFSVATALTGTYKVRFSTALRFLRKVVPNVTFGDSGATVNVTLTNGDVTGDNAVLGSDYAAVRTAYGSTAGAANWNAAADLDGDGIVLGSDFAIVRANYGTTGD